MTETEIQEHEHNFLRTYVRTLADGRKFIIYLGVRPADELILMCDECGEEKPVEGEP